MTRINTNVSALIAQNSLNRSNIDLQTSLQRLSTGLKINRARRWLHQQLVEVCAGGVHQTLPWTECTCIDTLR
jgi:hypothetical protein